jgi:hypothetical protein
MSAYLLAYIGMLYVDANVAMGLPISVCYCYHMAIDGDNTALHFIMK